AGLAVAALRHLLLDPRLLQRMLAVEALDRRDLATGGHLQRRLARADRFAVEMHGAGTALRGATAELGSRHLELFTDHPQQGCIVGRIHVLRPPIDGQCYHASSLGGRSPPRLILVRTRFRRPPFCSAQAGIYRIAHAGAPHRCESDREEFDRTVRLTEWS